MEPKNQNESENMSEPVFSKRDILSCKFFYGMKYAFGFLLIFAAPFLSAGNFFLLFLLLSVLSLTPFIEFTAHFFGITDDSQIKRMRNDFQSFVIVLTFGFLAVLAFDLFHFSFESYLLFQGFAIALLSSRSFYSLTHPVTLSFDWDHSERFQNASLLYELALIVLRVAAAFLTGWWILYITGGASSGFDLFGGMAPELLNHLLFISLIGALVGSLFESIPSKMDKNVSMFFGSVFSMWLLFLFGYETPWNQTLIAAVFSVVLAFLAYRSKIADLSALFSAAILGILIILFSGIEWYILLVAFFILGGGFTKYKIKYKASIGLAESKNGIRSYENVFANSFFALILAVMFGVLTQYPAYDWLSVPITFAYIGAVATATGDTMASEIGTTSKGPTYMITTFKRAKVGQDGGVSLLGEGAAFLGSGIIGLLAFFFGMVESLPLALLVAIVGGFLGTNIDSLLGATLQKKGILTNSSVNLISTGIGGLFSGILYFILQFFM
ncbi:TIGR00297 family protein [Methanolapillus ohkumae]|uniref:TIGR00297 family protein n=1 Tax=Methanolapillus ohkumae TaxID=3028298 RepID=A0AA96ZXU0_9EURY|nr:hypothetical protein MsAm2_12240 [Methanosarcinaceae archaeon Am2]